MKENRFPIDAVITWVDGNDKQHEEKRRKYGTPTLLKTEDVAGSTRFTSVGEILYCVASINRFAPWINKIYIVTDEQDPKVSEFIKKYFPTRQIPIEIIDHKTIFHEYEEFLPTFNSISIESMTWRIPGLSEHYIEFNDDFILTAPTLPEDFFTGDGKVVCYGKRYSTLLVKITRIIKRRRNGEKRVTFKETMLNAATLLGKRWFFIKIYHTPRALLKSIYKRYFTTCPEQLKKNISYRFRNHKQFNPQEIQYLLLNDNDRCILKKAYDNLLYLKPKKDIRYTEKKLSLFDKCKEFKFGCINSLDQADKETQEIILNWIQKRIGLKK